jgi:hypothetical protein
VRSGTSAPRGCNSHDHILLALVSDDWSLTRLGVSETLCASTDAQTSPDSIVTEVRGRKTQYGEAFACLGDDLRWLYLALGKPLACTRSTAGSTTLLGRAVMSVGCAARVARVGGPKLLVDAISFVAVALSIQKAQYCAGYACTEGRTDVAVPPRPRPSCLSRAGWLACLQARK